MEEHKGIDYLTKATKNIENFSRDSEPFSWTKVKESYDEAIKTGGEGVKELANIYMNRINKILSKQQEDAQKFARDILVAIRNDMNDLISHQESYNLSLNELRKYQDLINNSTDQNISNIGKTAIEDIKKLHKNFSSKIPREFYQGDNNCYFWFEPNKAGKPETGVIFYKISSKGTIDEMEKLDQEFNEELEGKLIIGSFLHVSEEFIEAGKKYLDRLDSNKILNYTLEKPFEIKLQDVVSMYKN